MAPRWHPSISTSYLVASSPGSVGLGLVLAIGGAWWSFAPTPLASVACGERFECNCASVLAGWSGSARTPPANEDSKRREVARLSISAFYRRATSPRYHPTGQCRHDCQYLAGLRPDHAQPWPALPCHDVTIALDERIATLGKALPRRRLAIFQWLHVGMLPSQRLTWSPLHRARWGFAPTSPGFWTGWGFAPPPLRRK